MGQCASDAKKAVNKHLDIFRQFFAQLSIHIRNADPTK